MYSQKKTFFTMTRLLGHNRIGTWNMKYPLLPSKVRVFNGQFFKSFLNDLIMLFDQTNIPVLSVIKVIFQFQCATWISSLTTISIQWPTSWSLEGKIIKTSEGTLYNVILRIARNLLETRENIKIESHPFYHIICDWFSWG